jgi:hypothetical protein
MDEDLIQRLVPTRAKGRPSATDRKGEEAWAEASDWRNNQQHLNLILRSVIARLDSTYRREYGVRLDQISESAELIMSALQSADWYKHADARYRDVGIYSHVYSGLDSLLGKRARRRVHQRGTRAGA